MSVFPLPSNIDSPYLVHTLIIARTCQPGMSPHLDLLFMVTLYYFVIFTSNFRG